MQTRRLTCQCTAARQPGLARLACLAGHSCRGKSFLSWQVIPVVASHSCRGKSFLSWQVIPVVASHSCRGKSCGTGRVCRKQGVSGQRGTTLARKRVAEHRRILVAGSAACPTCPRTVANQAWFNKARFWVARPESAKGVGGAAPRPSQTQGVPPRFEPCRKPPWRCVTSAAQTRGCGHRLRCQRPWQLNSAVTLPSRRRQFPARIAGSSGPTGRR